MLICSEEPFCNFSSGALHLVFRWGGWNGGAGKYVLTHGTKACKTPGYLPVTKKLNCALALKAGAMLLLPLYAMGSIGVQNALREIDIVKEEGGL